MAFAGSLRADAHRFGIGLTKTLATVRVFSNADSRGRYLCASCLSNAYETSALADRPLRVEVLP
jgi:hypothetical protein